jgi:hypothetical protein
MGSGSTDSASSIAPGIVDGGVEGARVWKNPDRRDGVPLETREASLKTRLPFLVSLLALASAETVSAHPYLPLESGRMTVFDYSFRVENSKMGQVPPSVRGRIIVKTGSFEEKAGRLYLRYITSYRNIPYQAANQELWRREENGDVYLGMMRKKRWVETLELPADVSVGLEWDYDDGEKSRRKVTRKLEIKLPSGESLADCVEVTREITHNKKLAGVINKSYYCRDKGDAGSVFLQPSPAGDYLTETKARSFESRRESEQKAP